MRVGEIWKAKENQNGSSVTPVKIVRLADDVVYFLQGTEEGWVCHNSYNNQYGSYRTARLDFLERYEKDYNESR